MLQKLLKKRKFSKGGKSNEFRYSKKQEKILCSYNGAGGRGIFNFDIDFTGGTAIDVNMGKQVENSEIAKVITEVTGQSNPQIQDVLGTNEVTIKMQSVDSATRTKLTDQMKKTFGLSDDAILSVQDISGSMSGEMQKTAAIAVTIACVAMLILFQ